MSSSVKKEFNKLCNPARVYLVISAVSLLIYIMAMVNHLDKMHTVNGLVIQTLSMVIWTLVLNWVCSLKYGNKIAWFLVFLPMILVFIMIFFIIYLVSEKKITSDELKQFVESTKEDENKEGFCGSCS